MQSEKLEALYDAHSKTVYWAAYKVLNDKNAASDAMQNVFLNACRHIEKLGELDENQQRAWLYRAAVNNSIDIIRKNKRLVSTEDIGVYTPSSSDNPEEMAEKNELIAGVRDALNKLPDKYKEPLYLYYFADLDYRQITQLLSLNEGTLKSRMSRARGLLENILKKGGAEING